MIVQQSAELLCVAGQFGIREAGDEITQRDGLVDQQCFI